MASDFIFVEADGKQPFSVGRFKSNFYSRSSTSLPRSCILHRFNVRLTISLDNDLMARVCTFPIDCTPLKGPQLHLVSQCLPYRA